MIVHNDRDIEYQQIRELQNDWGTKALSIDLGNLVSSVDGR